MGLFDKLFGLGLAIAGVTIAIYFTLWTLMVLVRLLCHLTFTFSLLSPASFLTASRTSSSTRSGSSGCQPSPSSVESPSFPSGSRRPQPRLQQPRQQLQQRPLKPPRKFSEVTVHDNISCN
jgi:hypothetical protein